MPFSLSRLKDALEINRIIIVPFGVLAFLNQWHEDIFFSDSWSIVAMIFVLVVIGSFFSLYFIYEILRAVDYSFAKVSSSFLHGTPIPIYPLAYTTLISFSLFYFYPIEPLSEINETWYLLAGACGLHILSVQMRVDAIRAKFSSNKYTNTHPG